MKEHPLIFGAESVRGLMSGLKTQSRRVPSWHNSLVDGTRSRKLYADLDFSQAWVDNGPSPAGNPGPHLKAPRISEDTVHRVYPQWQVGDRIWAREALRWKDDYIVYDVDGARLEWPEGWKPKWVRDYLSPIFMYRWAARIILEITRVRAQRIREISEEDILAEGFQIQGRPRSDGKTEVRIAGDESDQLESMMAAAMSRGEWSFERAAFVRTWNLLNAKRGCSWSSNGWIYALSFQRIKP